MTNGAVTSGRPRRPLRLFIVVVMQGLIPVSTGLGLAAPPAGLQPADVAKQELLVDLQHVGG